MGDKDTDVYSLRAYRGREKVREQRFTREEITLGNRDAADAKIKRFLDGVLTEPRPDHRGPSADAADLGSKLGRERIDEIEGTNAE